MKTELARESRIMLDRFVDLSELEEQDLMLSDVRSRRIQACFVFTVYCILYGFNTNEQVCEAGEFLQAPALTLSPGKYPHSGPG